MCIRDQLLFIGGVMGSKKSNRSRRRRKTSGANKAAMLAIALIVCVLFLTLLGKGLSLRSRVIGNDAAKDSLNAQIAAEEERAESIAALKDYYNSEEYIRLAAKEKLGLVEDGELVFRPITPAS